ncbi:6,7-dimethyl-8-ribityllumazine synthase [Mariniblastus sp.]|jgi:6,7-dimethyl-8-ribityllumazine synthase|nr:6,7-dimethyl-8-ribityllumazine synthase [Mariniblastus sp.]MDB4757003.1 6,7-dimethyl-8-ribityllumazine synthase [Mariniblastus sp.]
MVVEIRGELAVDDDKLRFAIVVSKYNSSITDKLRQGSIDTLKANGVSEKQIDVFYVPGAWELSVTAKCLADNNQYSAIICLGAVIKGETTHDQYINQQVSHSLGQISVEYRIPVAFGLLTCNSMEQAIHRAGGNVGNKGVECAEAALEMVNLLHQIEGPMPDHSTIK